MAETKKTHKNKTGDIPVVDVYSLAGKKVDKFKLNPEVFNSAIRKELLHQVVVMYRANKRQGTASTKKRGEVRGGGKKPWRQKGTGRARVGSIRSPIWTGGGVVFGPKPRDYGFDLPKKMKRLAVMSSLSAKTKDNELVVLETDPELKEAKTKDMTRILSSLKIKNKKVLLLSAKNDKKLTLSCRNIKNLTLRPSSDFNAYDVLSSARVVFSKDTHASIVKRLAK